MIRGRWLIIVGPAVFLLIAISFYHPVYSLNLPTNLPSSGTTNKEVSPLLADINGSKQKVSLTAMLDDDITQASWNLAINASLAELQKRHPNLDIRIDFKLLPYDDLKEKGLSAIGNKTAIDLISLDQIWLGEFAQKGYLTDLTSRAKE